LAHILVILRKQDYDLKNQLDPHICFGTDHLRIQQNANASDVCSPRLFEDYHYFPILTQFGELKWNIAKESSALFALLVTIKVKQAVELELSSFSVLMTVF